MELCYLHLNDFKVNRSILKLLSVKKDEKYVIMRFVSWGASHDIGHFGLTLEMKRKLAMKLSKYAKVFISSEGELPENLKQYQIKIPPERMHDVLYYALFYFGEGGTMATESAILGTLNILINPLAKDCGTHIELHNKYNLQYYYNDIREAIPKALEFINTKNIKTIWQDRCSKMLLEKIDVTAFLIWFVENYPCDPSDLVHFRKRIGKDGAEKIFQISVATRKNEIRSNDVLIDTTAQEKNITYSTDAKLLLKVIKLCNKISKQEKILSTTDIYPNH